MNWYSRIDQLNDPYEFYLIDNTGEETYEIFKKSLCVCCFSKNMNSILMWSHYADNHRGVCLEWDFDTQANKGRFFEMEYHNVVTVLDEVKRTNTGHLSLNIETNGKFLTTKFQTWQHEEEIRMIRVEEDLKLKGMYSDFPGKINAIHFGRNASNEDIELVKANTKHLDNIRFDMVDLNIETMKNDRILPL
jgi:hypothetical protein